MLTKYFKRLIQMLTPEDQEEQFVTGKRWNNFQNMMELASLGAAASAPVRNLPPWVLAPSQVPPPQSRDEVPLHHSSAGYGTLQPQPRHVPVNRCHTLLLRAAKPEDRHLELGESCLRKARCLPDCACQQTQQDQLKCGLHLGMFSSSLQTSHTTFSF